jgi:hypothetical protein
MTELTKEQIAQGWKPHDRIPESPVKRGDIWQGAEFLPNGKLHIREIVRGGDPEMFAWEFFDAYRTFSPDLPSPPVSGGDLFAENAKNSPLTNEPVGVTTREEWEAAQHALASLEACSFYSTLGKEAGILALTVRKVLNRLPAAKEPPINGAQ